MTKRREEPYLDQGPGFRWERRAAKGRIVCAQQERHGISGGGQKATGNRALAVERAHCESKANGITKLKKAPKARGLPVGARESKVGGRRSGANADSLGGDGDSGEVKELAPRQDEMFDGGRE